MGWDGISLTSLTTRSPDGDKNKTEAKTNTNIISIKYENQNMLPWCWLNQQLASLDLCSCLLRNQKG